LIAPVTAVQAINNSMAQTGFTGLLRIPHADALPFGDLSLNYHLEDNIDDETGYSVGAHDTILLGVGLLPGLEFSVQNTHKVFSADAGFGGDKGSDLSFSAKYDFKPFLPEDWFSFALGVQDYGGAASHHKNAYAVASKTFFPGTFYHFRLTTGYGKGDDGNQMGADYLQGPFAGIEWQPLQWLQLLSDYDGTGVNGGVKLFTPDNWLPADWQGNLTYQVYSGSSTDNRDNQWVGVGLTLPLAIGVDAKRYDKNGVNESLPLAAEQQKQLAAHVEKSTQQQAAQQTADLPSLAVLTENEDSHQQAASLTKKLVDYGFENVRVGWRGETLVVSLENNLFNWNELDALGVALGLMTERNISTSFEFYLLNNQLAVLKVSGNSQQFRDYLQQTAEQPVKAHGLTISTKDLETQNVAWLSERQASGNFVPRLIFSPNLRSAIGTELGVFDYSLALSSNLQMSLWPGGVADVRHLLPVSHSEDYDDGEYFAASRHESEVDRILFHQAFMLPASIMTQFSVGQVYKSYRGIVNETRWESASGKHRIKSEIGDFDHEDNDFTYQPILASYRYYLRGLDAALEGTYGQYWAGDVGGSVSLTKWYGDMSVQISYQNTECDSTKT
ncbi:MAG: YjbH domain-containing protein, partial [Psychromonas sp.]